MIEHILYYFQQFLGIQYSIVVNKFSIYNLVFLVL